MYERDVHRDSEGNSEIRTHTVSNRDADLRIASDVTTANDVTDRCKQRQMTAVMETRVSSVKVEKYRPLELVKLPDIKVSQEEIKKLQTGDETLRRCREIN